MLLAVLASSAALGAVALEPHVTAVEHQGTRYEVTYQPHLRTRMRTVGTTAGTRPSTELCRWSDELQVSRRVAGVSGSDRLLDSTHTVEGSRSGRCRFVKAAVEADRARQLGRLRARLAELTAEDRPALLAELAHGRAVAAN